MTSGPSGDPGGLETDSQSAAGAVLGRYSATESSKRSCVDRCQKRDRRAIPPSLGSLFTESIHRMSGRTPGHFSRFPCRDIARDSGRKINHRSDHQDHCQPDQHISNLPHGRSLPHSFVVKPVPADRKHRRPRIAPRLRQIIIAPIPRSLRSAHETCQATRPWIMPVPLNSANRPTMREAGSRGRFTRTEVP